MSICRFVSVTNKTSMTLIKELKVALYRCINSQNSTYYYIAHWYNGSVVSVQYYTTNSSNPPTQRTPTPSFKMEPQKREPAHTTDSAGTVDACNNCHSLGTERL